MVSTSKLFLGTVFATIAALSIGSPLESNPVTPVADVVELNHFHPAFGAEVSPFEAEFITWNVSFNYASSNPSLRRVETTIRDIQRLESFFGQSIETNFNKLSIKYETIPVPWPGDYWAVVRDGINAKWGSDASPSEKYARAFGLDVKNFMNTISASNGIDSQSYRPECKTYSDCSHLNDGSSCGKREGEKVGRCIPDWFGICHAWAPAALLEPEPKCPVTRNGVTFEPMDLKALMTQIYDGARVGTVFTGMRYDGPDDTNAKDKYGRFTNAARRDLGPGFFHIAMANVMARYKRSFVVDVSSGSQVWNQPARGYEVLEKKLLTPVEAAQKYYNTNKYPFNDGVSKLMYVKNRFSWIVESTDNRPLVSTGAVDIYTSSADYEYLLELDAKNNIIGGEWIGYSNERHPDFLWFPTSKPADNTVTNVGISYKHIKNLLNDSINRNC
jgi:hypothetical protein